MNIKEYFGTAKVSGVDYQTAYIMLSNVIDLMLLRSFGDQYKY